MNNTNEYCPHRQWLEYFGVVITMKLLDDWNIITYIGVKDCLGEMYRRRIKSSFQSKTWVVMEFFLIEGISTNKGLKIKSIEEQVFNKILIEEMFSAIQSGTWLIDILTNWSIEN